MIARGGKPVGDTGYSWHHSSDGMACFAANDGDWIVVSVRFELKGRDLHAFAGKRAYLANSGKLEPDRTYTVAASAMIAPRGRPVGTEVKAMVRYLGAGG
jgi:hypothetical protein